MAGLPWYNAGTISVANGSDEVTGTLTAWTSNAKAGDIFFIDGLGYQIEAVNDNTSITLVKPYGGTTITDDPYDGIARFTAEWAQAAEISVLLANFVENQTELLSGTGAPSDGLGGDGSYYFRVDQPIRYYKSEGSWDDGVSLVGPTGATGPVGPSAVPQGEYSGITAYVVRDLVTYQGSSWLCKANSTGNAPPTLPTTSNTYWQLNASKGDTGNTGSTGATGATGADAPLQTGSSTTSRTLGVGTMTFTTQTGRGWPIGTRLRLASAANPATHYMEGVVDSYSGSSLSVVMDLFAGSGSRADWNIVIAGARGVQGATGSTGPQGDNYAATSSSSLTIGMGAKAFTIAAGKPYLAGTRVRASSAAGVANYMEGVVTSYVGTTLTVNVDRVGGSGTLADWNINLQGQPGADGTGVGDMVSSETVCIDGEVFVADGTSGKLFRKTGKTLAMIQAEAVAAVDTISPAIVFGA